MKKCSECEKVYDDNTEICTCGQLLSLIVTPEGVNKEQIQHEFPNHREFDFSSFMFGCFIMIAIVSLIRLFITGNVIAATPASLIVFAFFTLGPCYYNADKNKKHNFILWLIVIGGIVLFFTVLFFIKV